MAHQLTRTSAPIGAASKLAAPDGKLLRHRGPALGVDGSEDAASRLDDPNLEVTPQHVLVMRNAGPIAAGMPEAGSMPIPVRLAREGITDMVRVSHARMSGTAYGTIVLQVSPEAVAGGPLALVAMAMRSNSTFRPGVSSCTWTKRNSTDVGPDTSHRHVPNVGGGAWAPTT
jgi:hypothetical protein